MVAEEANTRMKEVSSAHSKVENDRGIATKVANSKSEQGDQLYQRAVRYNGARKLGLEEHNVDRNKAEATNDQVTVVAETPQHEFRRASKSLFSDSMSDLANISMSPD